MFCNKCGKEHLEGTKYCTQCGNPLANVANEVGNISNNYDPDNYFSGYAGFWKRFLAAIIDGIITNIVGSVFRTIVGLSVVSQSTSVMDPKEMVAMIFSVIAGWLYFALMESSSKQATLGKMALGIVVTDLDGNRISLGKATVRHFSKIVSAITLGIGFIMAGFTQRKQALHDMMAGCLVVNK